MSAATVRAPALALTSCSSTLTYHNFTEPLSPEWKQVWNITAEAGDGILPSSRNVFMTNFYSTNGSREHLKFITSISDSKVAETCAGYVNLTECYYASATAEYDIEITGDVISLVTAPDMPKIVGLADNTALTEESISEFGLREDGSWIKTTLGGIMQTAYARFETRESLLPSPIPGDTPQLGQFRNIWFAYTHITNYEAWDNEELCAPSWKDPRDDILASLNQLMFRIGVYTAQHYNESYLKPLLDEGVEITYNTTGVPLSEVDVFHSDFSYFSGAVAVELFTILAILYTFYGWWRLGRATSFSPIEIAKVSTTPYMLVKRPLTSVGI